MQHFLSLSAIEAVNITRINDEDACLCSGATRRVLKKQISIRALINELELIRHSLVKKSPKCKVIVSRSGSKRT
ncbi:hypothetical protein Plhal304r1_c055g0140581 [Plasmopara halstedii]